MKKILSLALLFVLVLQFTINPADVYAVAVTAGANGTWSSAGTNNDDGTLAQAESGAALDLSAAGVTVTIQNNGVANDSNGLNTFNVGAITNTGGTGNILVSTGSAANLNVTIASVNIGSNFTARNRDADDRPSTTTVSGALTAASLNVTNNDADSGVNVTLNVNGNTTISGVATITNNTGGGAGARATLQLYGVTNSASSWVLDSAVGTAGNPAQINLDSDNAKTLSGAITTTLAGAGNVLVGGAGDATFFNQIGTNALYVGSIVFDGVNKTTTFNTNVFASTFQQNDASTIDIGTNTIDLNGSADGDFIMNANGTLKLTINSASVFGNVLANGGGGDVTLADTNTVNVRVNGALANGTAFTVINGDAGIASLPTVTDNSALLSFTPSEPSAGDLQLTATTSSDVAKSANAANVLTGIQGALTSSSGSADFNAAMGQLYSISDAASANQALESLDPTNNGANTQASFAVANEAIDVLTNHLSEVGAMGSEMTGISTGDFWKDYGWWIKGFGSSADQGNRKGVNGYDSTLWGTTTGFDVLVHPDVRLGISGGYASTDVDNKGESGGTDINSYLGTIYLRYDNPSPWYVNSGFNFTWNDYTSMRSIDFAARRANADYDGQVYTGFIDAGYVVKQKQWEITPMGSFTYSRMALENYTETGAGALNLNVRSENYDMAQGGLGVKLARPIEREKGKWVPEVHTKLLYDFVGDRAATTATFTGGGSSFSTKGLDPAQLTYNVGTGLTFYSKGHISVSGVYDLELKNDYMSHSGQAVLRYQF